MKRIERSERNGDRVRCDLEYLGIQRDEIEPAQNRVGLGAFDCDGNVIKKPLSPQAIERAAAFDCK